MHADRCATRHKQHIVFQSAFEILFEFGRIVACDAEQHGLYAQRLHLPHQRVSIGVGYLVGINRVIDGFELVAGGQDRHAWFAIHLHVRAFDRRQYADHAGCDLGALSQHHIAGLHVFSAQPHVVAGLYGEVYLHHISRYLFGILDSDHRIRSLWQCGTCHDARTLSGLGQYLWDVAGFDILDDLQNGCCTRQIGRAHRKSIHRGHVKGRQVAVGKDVIG